MGHRSGRHGMQATSVSASYCDALATRADAENPAGTGYGHASVHPLPRRDDGLPACPMGERSICISGTRGPIERADVF